MLDETRRKTVLRDLPQFFETDSVLLRRARGIQTITGDRLFRQRPARPLREQHILAEQFHPSGEPRLRMTVAADAHVSRRETDPLPLVAVQKLRPLNSGKDLAPEPPAARPHPAHVCHYRADEIAMVAHQPRH